MATVKITELPEITTLQANTANTVLVGVDLPSSLTGKYTLTTIARELYSNNSLAVGNNFTVLPNVVGQFTGTSTNYVQLNLQNRSANGSGDVVVTADTGDDDDYYVNMGIAGSTYNFPGYTFAKPLDGYLVAQGSNTTPSAIGGNLVIGTTTVGKNITFTQGSFDESGRVAQFQYNTGFKLLKHPLIFADGTSQNTAVDYPTINSRITANAASANSVINTRISANVATLRGEITNNIATQNTFTQAAFNKANSALANASGTFAGDLDVTGNVNIGYSMHIHKPDMPGNGIFLLITGSEGGSFGDPSNPGYTIQTVSPDNVGNRIVAESYANVASGYAAFIARRGRGTAGNPLPVQSGDVIARFAGNGYGTTKFSQFGDGRIEVHASGNHTDTSKPTKIVFYTTEINSNSATQIAEFTGNTAAFAGYVNAQKGFVANPRVPAGDQTAITIDYTTDSIIKANLTADLTISHTNFVAGKYVELWLTNTGAQNRTVTHGISALNSTNKSTTYTIIASSSAFFKFFSIDGDLANTFVTII